MRDTIAGPGYDVKKRRWVDEPCGIRDRVSWGAPAPQHPPCRAEDERVDIEGKVPQREPRGLRRPARQEAPRGVHGLLFVDDPVVEQAVVQDRQPDASDDSDLRASTDNIYLEASVKRVSKRSCSTRCRGGRLPERPANGYYRRDFSPGCSNRCTKTRPRHNHRPPRRG